MDDMHRNINRFQNANGKRHRDDTPAPAAASTDDMMDLDPAVSEALLDSLKRSRQTGTDLLGSEGEKNSLKNSDTAVKHFQWFLKTYLGITKDFWDFPLYHHDQNVPTLPNLLLAYFDPEFELPPPHEGEPRFTHVWVLQRGHGNKKKGDLMERATVENYFSALQRHFNKEMDKKYSARMNGERIPYANFHSDDAFRLVNVMKNKLEEQMPNNPVHYPVPCAEDARRILNAPLLHSDSPYATFCKRGFTCGCTIWPRGGAEYSSLTLDMFQLLDGGMPWVSEREPGERVVFYASKLPSKTGKRHDPNQFKDQTFFPNRERPDLCFVQQFKDEVQMRKERGFKCTAFFLALKYDRSTHTYVDFLDAPIQDKIRANFMRNISISAKTKIIYTNHCIRAWMITEALASGAQEHVVKERSRHASDCAVKTYKKISFLESRALSDVTTNRTVGGQQTLHDARQQIAHSALAPPQPPAQNPIVPMPARDPNAFFQSIPPSAFNNCVFNFNSGDNYHNNTYNYYTPNPMTGLSQADLEVAAATPVDPLDFFGCPAADDLGDDEFGLMSSFNGCFL
ncbi:hypothetical protein CYMTET_52630 [Cymbomonas tetramitiformis]|uniref:Uncharacterized protein n=1 Tax=Cymbomonas tetramitiformis TaxID=36881 RepID=A0AAE0BKH6_9CHLO|nr:hypothetical protein CYMTET_52630 [Cymbomonas tetramitiformis]